MDNNQAVKTYWHGTSTVHNEAIKANGLQPPVSTGNHTEKRNKNLDKVFLAPDTDNGRLFAEGYAIRASLKFGGEPLVLKLKIDNSEHLVRLERKGDVDQWYIEGLPANCILEEITLPSDDPEVMTERMVAIFNSVKHKKSDTEHENSFSEGETTRV